MRIPLIDFVRILGKGKDKSLTGLEIMQITGLNSRELRQLVGEAQKEGFPVVNMQDGKGYYICTDPQELMRYCKQERNRALSNLKRVSYLNKYLEEHGFEMQGLSVEGLLG